MFMSCTSATSYQSFGTFIGGFSNLPGLKPAPRVLWGACGKGQQWLLSMELLEERSHNEATNSSQLQALIFRGFPRICHGMIPREHRRWWKNGCIQMWSPTALRSRPVTAQQVPVPNVLKQLWHLVLSQWMLMYVQAILYVINSKVNFWCWCWFSRVFLLTIEKAQCSPLAVEKGKVHSNLVLYRLLWQQPVLVAPKDRFYIIYGSRIVLLRLLLSVHSHVALPSAAPQCKRCMSLTNFLACSKAAPFRSDEVKLLFWSPLESWQGQGPSIYTQLKQIRNADILHPCYMNLLKCPVRSRDVNSNMETSRFPCCPGEKCAQWPVALALLGAMQENDLVAWLGDDWTRGDPNWTKPVLNHVKADTLKNILGSLNILWMNQRDTYIYISINTCISSGTKKLELPRANLKVYLKQCFFSRLSRTKSLARNLISLNSAMSACEKAGRWEEVLSLMETLAGAKGWTWVGRNLSACPLFSKRCKTRMWSFSSQKKMENNNTV